MTQPTPIFLRDAVATHNLGIALGKRLAAGSVLLLDGELGSGKTSLVQGIGVGLGLSTLIDSPTFTLINEYFDGRVPLYHLDLYRLQPSDVKSLQPEMYWEGVEVPLGIVAIEWASHLLYKPTDYLQLYLRYNPDGSRQVDLAVNGMFDLSFLTQL